MHRPGPLSMAADSSFGAGLDPESVDVAGAGVSPGDAVGAVGMARGGSFSLASCSVGIALTAGVDARESAGACQRVQASTMRFTNSNARNRAFMRRSYDFAGARFTCAPR